jgi:hypothetical protein
VCESRVARALRLRLAPAARALRAALREARSILDSTPRPGVSLDRFVAGAVAALAFGGMRNTLLVGRRRRPRGICIADVKEQMGDPGPSTTCAQG